MKFHLQELERPVGFRKDILICPWKILVIDFKNVTGGNIEWVTVVWGNLQRVAEKLWQVHKFLRRQGRQIKKKGAGARII